MKPYLWRYREKRHGVLDDVDTLILPRGKPPLEEMEIGTDNGQTTIVWWE